MEGLSFIKLVEIAAEFGLPGLILVLWWVNDRARNRDMQTYRENIQKILQKYKEDVQEARRMYESNVKLVQAYEDLAKDLKDVIILNTQSWQRASDDIRNNQYCPHVRLRKQASGKDEP
jgi:hypothetical protein